MKRTDLGKRTFLFARRVRKYVRTIQNTLYFSGDCQQVMRSSGSIGANYIEANEAVSTKERLYRFSVCRKEAKETLYWLHLLGDAVTDSEADELSILKDEAQQLVRIFSKITNSTRIKS